MNLSDDKSIYLQIGQSIEDSILREVFLEEERVPSTNELAQMYKINPATAAKGINILVDEGILYKKRGIGMFVATGAKKTVVSKRKTSFYQSFILSLVTEAKSLDISKAELVQMLDKAQNEVNNK